MTGLRFLLDVNVGLTIRNFLLNLGHDVSSVIDIDRRMSDEHILRLAVEEQRILITCDKDFGDLIFNRRFSHTGVIRLEDTTPRLQLRYLDSIFKKHHTELSTSLIVAQAGMIRVRR